ncbi:MAG: Hpt domain-containing protein [Lachnospiraceae bacterium]|nr:Hpt domain-containing protein [Lachnospiraceae bacterium]
MDKMEIQTNLPQVEGVDFAYALCHLQKMELLKKTISDFMRMTSRERDRLESLKKDLDEAAPEDYPEALRQYRVLVHSMKNTSATIGALTVSAMAKELEYAARDEKKDVIDGKHPTFIAEWQALSDRLAEAFSEQSEKEKAKDLTAADPNHIKSLLPKILEAIEDMDVDTADALMQEMSAYRYAADVQPFVEELKEATEFIDEDKVRELTEEIGKRL